jgi:hypothetical protein
MATFTETGTGGSGVDGDAVFSFTPSDGRLAFQSKFTTGVAHVRQPDGTYLRRHVGRFITNDWGDGYYETAQGPLEYAENVVSPEELPVALRIIDDIGSADLFRRYINDFR